MTKKVYSEIEKMDLIRKYEEAQVSMAKFAKEKGVARSTFSQWVHNREKPKFGKIEIEDTKELVAESASTIALTYNSEKINIEIKKGYDPKMLEKIVEVLRNVK